MMQQEELVRIARSYIGKIRYANCEGGPHPQDPLKGMTCYNFLRLVARESGIHVPDSTGLQYVGCWEMWEILREAEPMNGVAVFFNGRRDGKPAHVGIYTGDETVIHLSKERGTVTEDSLVDLERVGAIMGYRLIDD